MIDSEIMRLSFAIGDNHVPELVDVDFKKHGQCYLLKLISKLVTG